MSVAARAECHERDGMSAVAAGRAYERMPHVGRSSQKREHHLAALALALVLAVYRRASGTEVRQPGNTREPHA